jgi:hypothetical protein
MKVILSYCGEMAAKPSGLMALALKWPWERVARLSGWMHRVAI